MAEKTRQDDSIKALEARVAQLEKTVAGSLSGRAHYNSTATGAKTGANTLTTHARTRTPAVASGLLAAASSACIVLGWLGCCMITFNIGKLAQKMAGQGPLVTHMSYIAFISFAGSMAILAGGVGLMLRRKWGWWLAEIGFLASFVVLTIVMIFGRGVTLTYVIDTAVVLGMMIWLIWLRGDVFR